MPTKFSNTELFPADCPPTTAIWGKSRVICTPNWVKASCSLFTIGISCSIPVLPAIFRPEQHVFHKEKLFHFTTLEFINEHGRDTKLTERKCAWLIRYYDNVFESLLSIVFSIRKNRILFFLDSHSLSFHLSYPENSK